MTPEEFEKLTKKEQAEVINEYQLDQEWFGQCGGCREKIKAKLRDFPIVCKRCGFGSTD